MKLPVVTCLEAKMDCTRKDESLIVCQEQEMSLESRAVDCNTSNDLPKTAINNVFDMKELSRCESSSNSQGGEILAKDSLILVSEKQSNTCEEYNNSKITYLGSSQ